MNALTPGELVATAFYVLVGLYFIVQLPDNILIAREMITYARSKPPIRLLVEYAKVVTVITVNATAWAILGVQTAVFRGSQAAGFEPITLLPPPIPIFVIFAAALINSRGNKGTIRYVRSLRLKRAEAEAEVPV